MNENWLRYYENIFNINKKRIKELINTFAKDVVERILREELIEEYIIETIYQIGKTEDERLFLAFLMGEIKQTVFARIIMGMIVEKLIEINTETFTKNMNFYMQLTDVFWEKLSNKLGTPDFDELLKEDKDFIKKMFLASKKLGELEKRRGKDDKQRN